MNKHLTTRTINGIEVTTGSGNVFADLGLPNADKLKIKSGLVIEIKVRPAAEPLGHLKLALA